MSTGKFKNLKEYGESKLQVLQEIKESLLLDRIDKMGLRNELAKDAKREKKRFGRIAQSDSEVYYYKHKNKMQRIVTIMRHPEVKANKEGEIVMNLKYY